MSARAHARGRAPQAGARREGARGCLWPSSWGRALAGGMEAGEVANEYLGHTPEIRLF